ncbi:ataxin-7-like protein 1 isoform X1 [Nematostella vectensis]|uniref:ataxin-7-like protein 1 isoform X1 n=1 Tax=Nematostella vectensis TaxID=45351 RepID=UPI0020777B07|nr:ataxin-7-like protein 1 isoform X1 [Nematostella vectensis]
MAKIHCHSLLSGSSWDSFDEDSPDDEPEAMEVDENNTFCTYEATRLQEQDMLLFGLCPAQEQVCLVICDECKRVVKASAFPKHCAIKHQKESPPSVSPPEIMDSAQTMESILQSGSKSSPSDTAIKIENVEFEDDGNVKIEEVPLELNHSLTVNIPLSKTLLTKPIVKKASEKSNKKSPRKVIPTREREFDADKHCGVWVADQQKKCTRSLTCKTHALSLRRAVLGRRKPFDELLAEHKARVNSEKELNNQAALRAQELKAAKEENIINRVLINDITDTVHIMNKANESRCMGSVSVEDEGIVPRNQEVAETDGVEENLSYSGIPTLCHHPNPMVMCSFGARRVGQGAIAFNRKQDRIRCAVMAMVERCVNPSLPRHSGGRPGAVAILHRPTVKTIAQSSNSGMSKGTSYADKFKSHGVFSSSNKNLNNFLKAPPPPRNKALRQNSMPHSNTSGLVENSAVYQTLQQGKRRMSDSSSGHLSVTNESVEFLKPDASSQAFSDMGNIIASIDANVSGGQPGHQMSNTVSNAFLAVASVSGDAGVSMGPGIALNSGAMITGTRTCYTSIATPLTATISDNRFNNANTAGMQGRVTIGTAATSAMPNKVVQVAGQLDVSTGKVTVTTAGHGPLVFTKQTTGGVQVSNCIVNGTGPSQTPKGANMKGYPVSFVIQNNTGQPAGSNPGYTKGRNLVFNSMGVAQLQQQALVQQSPSPMQQPQKGKVSVRKTYQKGQSKSNLQVKIPQSPSPQQPSPGQLSPGQPVTQKTIVVSSPQPGQQNLYLNHQHMSNTASPQPIVQLKQQVEQQQQQLQQITLQQQLQQQQLQQQQLQQQKQLNPQFVKQQLPIQPRIAPAPPNLAQQTYITQQQFGNNQNIVIKNTEQPLKSPPNSVFVTNDAHIQATVVHKPQSNVA